MKKYLLLASLFVSQIALAHVIEVNEAQRTVFYTPNPILDVEVTDLDGDGGMFSLSLTYDSDAIKAEEEAMKSEYPGYAFRVLMAQHASPSISINIPAIELFAETLVKQGQMGPYLNYQTLLKPAQVEKLKALSAKADLIKIALPVVSSYQSLKVVEKYSSRTICGEFRAQRFENLLSALFSLKRPEGIQRAETFAAYKKSIIENCFDVSSAKVASFKELFQLEMKPKVTPGLVSASYSVSQSVNAKYELMPKLRLKMN